MIAALVQAPAQEVTVDERISAFLKGDGASRGELLKLGAFAIRPLQMSRDRDPEKIDALVYELKKGSVYPADSKIARSLERQVSVSDGEVELKDDQESAPIKLRDVRRFLPAPIFVLPFKVAELKSGQARIFVTDRPAHEILSQLFAQTGLDFAYAHNAVILGPPDKLWPAGPPPRLRKLTPDEEARAKSLVEKFNDEAIAVREGASNELLKLGLGALPILEAQLQRKEAQVAANCSALIRKLKESARPLFGPAFALSQELDPADAVIRKALSGDSYPQVRLAEVSLGAVVEILLAGRGHEVSIKAEHAKERRVPMIDAEGVGALDMVSLVTQMVGLDFAIQGGQIVIDTREALETAPRKGK